MIKCSRCKKRLAVIFVTKVDGGEKKTEGSCLHCASELGLPIKGVLGPNAEKLGLSTDQLIDMEDEMNNAMSSFSDENGDDGDGTPAVGDDGGAPSIDFMKLFGDMSSGGSADNSDNNRSKATASDHEGKGSKKHDFLDKYCKDLTELARGGKLDSIVGRQNELARVIQILCRRQKNNPCLIGEPGVGKTAIAEALAQ